MNLVTTRSPNFGSGNTLRVSALRRRDILSGLFRSFRAVKRTALSAVLHPLGVENAAEDMVAHARQVLHPPAADQHDGVFLQVVAFAGDVAHRLDARGQAHLGDLPQRRVRLLRRHRIDAGADAPALRRTLQGRHLVARDLVGARLADQLVDRRHSYSSASKRWLLTHGTAASDKHETAPKRSLPCVAARQRLLTMRRYVYRSGR